MCVDTPIHPSMQPAIRPCIFPKFTPSEHPSIHRSSLKPTDKNWLILFCGGDASISHLLPRRTRRNPKTQKLTREAGGKIVSPTFRLPRCNGGETTKEPHPASKTMHALRHPPFRLPRHDCLLAYCLLSCFV